MQESYIKGLLESASTGDGQALTELVWGVYLDIIDLDLFPLILRAKRSHMSGKKFNSFASFQNYVSILQRQGDDPDTEKYFPDQLKEYLECKHMDHTVFNKVISEQCKSDITSLVEDRFEMNQTFYRMVLVRTGCQGIEAKDALFRLAEPAHEGSSPLDERDLRWVDQEDVPETLSIEDLANHQKEFCAVFYRKAGRLSSELLWEHELEAKNALDQLLISGEAVPVKSDLKNAKDYFHIKQENEALRRQVLEAQQQTKPSQTSHSRMQDDDNMDHDGKSESDATDRRKGEHRSRSRLRLFEETTAEMKPLKKRRKLDREPHDRADHHHHPAPS